MKITDYLAIWGAVVATAVACWSIYRDVIGRNYVKLNAGFRLLIPPGEEVFVFDVTNHSDHKIKVTSCGGYADRRYQFRWLDKVVGRFSPRTGKAFLFSPLPSRSVPLPIPIEPHDSARIVYGIDKDNFPTFIEALEVTTADGREWFCSRKEIRAIHSDKTYQEIQSRKRDK